MTALADPLRPADRRRLRRLAQRSQALTGKRCRWPGRPSVLGGWLAPGSPARPVRQPAGVPVARENGFHALRHYFASALLYDGVDIRALAVYLGHHDPAFTLRVYAHLVPAADDRIRAVIDKAARGESDGPGAAHEISQ